ncbi:MAG: thioredoxin domain-containing protein [Polyangiaceae bacterium]
MRDVRAGWPRLVVLSVALASGCGGPACGATSSPVTAPTSAKGRDPALQARLDKALRDKGPDYAPRTRHKNPDGTPKYTNRLILESSPYLLQHAHNPVDWYPWGDEAFAAARAAGKPVFLSVGYSTCHWCHVMEEESFEDEEIAAYLNEHFIAIKVDREERPDVDAVYMNVVMSFSGNGGWPMNVWLTPAREPFFAGTYFPPRDGVRGARHGLLSVLRELSSDYAKDPAGIARDAKDFAERARKLSAPEAAGDMPSADVVKKAVIEAQQRFDPVNGGPKGAPKFPSSFPVRLLLRHARRSGDAMSLRMATATLDAILAGGIHDQAGGGFHRYATDAAWRIPHFEKMLYDNALLAMAYLEAGQATGEARFLAAARETLDYLLREMRAPDGTFHGATDADSLAPNGKREEGYFFTWTPREVESALDGDAEKAALAFFGVTERGDLDGRSILHVARPPADVAKDLGWDAARLSTAVAAARVGLYTARSKRPPPLRDDKALVAWNALAISAFARAAIVLGEARYEDAAVKCAQALTRTWRAGGPLAHAWTNGKESGQAYLDDHTTLANALLDVFDLTADPAFIDDAARLMAAVEKRFSDKTNGGYFMTADDAEPLLARDKPSDDGPTPSGNSMAALVWQRLSVLQETEADRAHAESTFRAFATSLAGRTGAMDAMLSALDLATDSPKQIAIVLPDGAARGALSKEARPMLDILQKAFIPNAALAVGAAADLSGASFSKLPWTKDKPAKGGRTTAYVCILGACKLPVTDPAEFAKLLAEAKPY